jgi:hypothetical protein
MSAHEIATPRLNDHLAEPLRVGEPDVHGPLAVFPIFASAPLVEYVPFAQGRVAGVSIKELEHGASVNDLNVVNPTAIPVLLYEGEEVLGAQQNRTFDVSVLVPAHGTLQVPVCCVEPGRWDGSRHGESFQPAPQVAYPELRRMKNRAASARAITGMEARAEQGAVWDEVAHKSQRLSANSATGAMHDIYEGRRQRLDEFSAAVSRRDAQCGTLVAIGGAFAVLDFVSRADAFAALHGPLVQGYALDAIEAADATVPSLDQAQAFVDQIADARITVADGIGLGLDARFATGRIAGSGLIATGELVQLTAFPEGEVSTDATPIPQARIRRPSRRRSA